jgi:hypothetical protein
VRIRTPAGGAATTGSPIRHTAKHSTTAHILAVATNKTALPPTNGTPFRAVSLTSAHYPANSWRPRHQTTQPLGGSRLKPFIWHTAAARLVNIGAARSDPFAGRYPVTGGQRRLLTPPWRHRPPGQAGRTRQSGPAPMGLVGSALMAGWRREDLETGSAVLKRTSADARILSTVNLTASSGDRDRVIVNDRGRMALR